MPQSWLDRQKAEVAKRVAAADVVISTALIPGRAAPTLISEDMVKSMKAGSVIVDIAAGKGPANADGSVGGNCPLSEADKTVVKHGVTIIGETNLAALVAAPPSVCAPVASAASGRPGCTLPAAPLPPSSGSKTMLSARKDTSAVTTSVSFVQNPVRGSTSGPTAVKSHQPWERFLPEKRCQESRPTERVAGSLACCTPSL
jgi:hypothetical protein